MPENLYRVGQTWYARVQIGGRAYRESLRTASLPEAKRRLKPWLKRATDQARFGIESHTWEDAVVAWFEHDCAGLKPGTRDRYRQSLRMVDPMLKGRDLELIGRAELFAISARQGVTNATRKRDLTAVMAVLRAAEARGWIPAIPDCGPARRQVRERRDPRILPPEHEADQLVTNCRGNLAHLVQILRLTGLRLEEAGHLQHRHVDLDRRVIMLDQTKTDRPRVVPLCDQGVSILASIPRHISSQWVFWHGAGRRYGRLTARLTKIRKRLGITWTTHDLRHLFAVRFLQTGQGTIYELQRVLGHTTLTTTEHYLDHLTPGEQRIAKREHIVTETVIGEPVLSG